MEATIRWSKKLAGNDGFKRKEISKFILELFSTVSKKQNLSNFRDQSEQNLHFPLKTQSEKQENCLKHRKMWMLKSQLFLVLHFYFYVWLIKSCVHFLDQSESKVKGRQSNSRLLLPLS